MKICVRMLWIAGFAATLTLGGCGKEEARTTESGAAPAAGPLLRHPPSRLPRRQRLRLPRPQQHRTRR